MSLIVQRKWVPTHTHIKTKGKYRLVTHAILEKTLEPYVVYDDEHGNVWLRPDKEFYDGRFEPIFDAHD